MEFKNCVMVSDSAQHSGGVSAVMLQQAAGLRAAGMRVYVFAAFGPADAALANVADGVVCMLSAPGTRKHLAEIWNRNAVLGLEQFLAGFSPVDTVVHIHSLSMGLSPSIGQALRALSIPYVITAHDAGWACPTGYFYHFNHAQPCTLEPLSVACLLSRCDKRSYSRKLFKVVKMQVLDHVSHLKSDAAAVIAPSALLHQRIRSRVPPATPLITLLNPINVDDQGPRDEALFDTADNAASPRFLFVGRLWEEKGIVELLHAIGERYPLTVVGDGPLRTALAARYPQVRFTGWLSPDAVAQEMCAARAVILPSVYLEAFGLVVAEALALGVPVIVSDRVGGCSMVEPGINGFVVDMARPQQMQDSCDALMDDTRAARMSRQAYLGYWRDPLSRDKYIAGLLKIFRGISVATAVRGVV